MTKLCRNLGGRTAVAEDAGALELMEKTFQDVCSDQQFFYAGFTDKKEDRAWLNVNNEEPLAWDNWAENNPVNLSLHDCITARIGKETSEYFPPEMSCCRFVNFEILISRLRNPHFFANRRSIL